MKMRFPPFSPEIDRALRGDVSAVLLFAVFACLTTPFIGLILRRELGATPLQLSVMSAAGGACLLLSLARAHASGRSRQARRGAELTSQDQTDERRRQAREHGEEEHRRDVDAERALDLRAEGRGSHLHPLCCILGGVTTNPSGPPELAGQVALVTGAGRGIGQAIALALAAVGADIAALDLEPPLETRARAEALTRRCLAIHADVADRTAAEAAVARTLAELGRLDVVVNNAGVAERLALEDLDDATQIGRA